ncbi:MAG: efflux RND transporter permease subunit [Syntrophales bacterium]|nr:efflux RND transporter permease subunit [Syntrophales bacterium]
MLKMIIQTSMKLRLPAIIIAVILVGLGIFQLRDTSIEVFPDFGPVRVEVQTEALGLSPEEVENLITNPMEQEFFNGMPWLHKIRSKSLPGLSSIEMIFEPGTDPIQARQVVQERLTMVPALPQVSKAPLVIQPVATTSRLMIIGLFSKKLSLIDISVLARWKIRQRLLSVPGVANVSIWGFRDRQLQVLIDPERLKKYKVRLDDVIQTVGNAMWSSPLTFVEASTPGTGGFIDTANQRIEIQHIQPIKTAKELAKVTVEDFEDRALTLGQVAQVVENHQLLIGDAIVKDSPGVLLVVERFPNTSIMEVTRRVDKALDAMRPGLSEIEIDTSIYRAASFVEAGHTNLIKRLEVGLVLLLIFLFVIYLPNWRKAFISIFTITLSMIAGWLVLSALGTELNMMVIAGLIMALVIIIDDGIVYIDNISYRLREHRSKGSSTPVAGTILAGALEMGIPLLTTLLIVVVLVAPVFVLGEVNGPFLQSLVRSYALAALVSMAATLIITPALSLALLTPEKYKPAESPIIAGLRRGYLSVLKGIVGKPVVAAVIAGVVIVAGVVLLPFIGKLNLIPQLKGHDFLVKLEASSGTSLSKMSKLTTEASKELRSIPGVRNVGGHIGRASTSDKLTNIDTAELWISIKQGTDHTATINAIKKLFNKGYPELKSMVTTYPNHRYREVAAEHGGDDLVVRVYGRFYDILEEKAEEIIKNISNVAGVVDPQIKLPVFEPTVEIEVLIPEAAAQGLKPGDVRRAAATMVAGITAGNLFEEQKIFDVVVWGESDKRDSLSDINEMPIETPNGNLVRLKDVADVRLLPNPSIIEHDAVSRYVDIIVGVQGRSLGEVTKDIEKRLAKINFPIEHHVEVLGEAVQRETKGRIFLGYIIAALIVVFFLLQSRFSSWRLASMLFLLLPLGLAGSVMAAILLPNTPSILSLMSGLAVAVITARGSILLITRYQHLEHKESKVFGPDLVLLGSEQRFGAILLSTLAIVLVTVPLLISRMVSGLELVVPIAAILFGGLLAATLLNLFVLPVLYLRFGANTKPEDLGLESSQSSELDFQ